MDARRHLSRFIGRQNDLISSNTSEKFNCKTLKCFYDNRN